MAALRRTQTMPAHGLPSEPSASGLMAAMAYHAQRPGGVSVPPRGGGMDGPGAPMPPLPDSPPRGGYAAAYGGGRGGGGSGPSGSGGGVGGGGATLRAGTGAATLAAGPSGRVRATDSAGSAAVTPPSAPPGNNIKVVVRLRPLSGGERQRGERAVVAADGPSSLLVNSAGAAHSSGAGAPPGSTADTRSFRFEAVLAPDVTQADVMTKCGVRHLLDSTLAGYTATVMAYGQTGSGKTFTMSGREEQADTYVEDELDETGLQREDGLILRSLAHLYARMEAAGGSAPGGPRFRVRASYLEIYNEAVYDLLDPGDPAQLQVRWDATRGAFHVPDARRVACDSLDDALLMVATGARNRRVASHELNKDSSRSHAICAVTVETTRPGNGPVTQGKISFVDLAGSERLKSSRSAGEQAKETGSINRSLMALGKVISALSLHGGRAGAGHIPYRDSKLTKLLMDSLGGGSLALMIACCSPAIGALEETLSTLTYATRAKNIVNSPLASTLAGGGGGADAGERAAAAAARAEEVAALRAALEDARAENEELRAELELARAAAARGSALNGRARPSDFGGPVLDGGSGSGSGGGPSAFVSALPPLSSLAERIGRALEPSGGGGERGGSPARSGSPRRALPPSFETRFGEASREQLLSLLAASEGALEGAAAENAALRAARNELQAEHAARAAEADALSAKLRDLEACFLETDRDGDAPFPAAVRRRMSSLLGPPPALMAEWDARGQSRASTARMSEASVADETDAYYRARTAPPPAAAARRGSGAADEAADAAAFAAADAARVATPPARRRPATAVSSAVADILEETVTELEEGSDADDDGAMPTEQPADVVVPPAGETGAPEEPPATYVALAAAMKRCSTGDDVAAAAATAAEAGLQPAAQEADAAS